MGGTEAEREENGGGEGGGRTRARWRRLERHAGNIWTREVGPMTRGPRHSAGGFKTRSDSNQVQTNSIQFVSNFD
jgi:hypothetical protein